MLSVPLEESSKQYAAVKKITEVVEQAEKLIDKDSYDKALRAVSTSDILNKPKKDHLLDRLDKVNDKLIALAEEKKQLEEAEKLAEVQAEESNQVQQQKSSTSSSNNVSNDTNKTISSPSKSMSNSENNNSKTNNQSSKQPQSNTNVENSNKTETNNKPSESKETTSGSVTNVKKTGEGKFKSYYGAEDGVGSWETGTFECNGCDW
ncbi:hypothetical protein [Ornithinibacillus sp. FSL M8-0202]|uniref:hypothetical protein n=1 Tax=Ornithinibacillus sp. FSL M8-0202 TaxID=2921616 RepID=UPI0030D5C767